jgi:hypothetical protein
MLEFVRREACVHFQEQRMFKMYFQMRCSLSVVLLAAFTCSADGQTGQQSEAEFQKMMPITGEVETYLGIEKGKPFQPSS